MRPLAVEVVAAAVEQVTAPADSASCASCTSPCTGYILHLNSFRQASCPRERPPRPSLDGDTFETYTIGTCFSAASL